MVGLTVFNYPRLSLCPARSRHRQHGSYLTERRRLGFHLRSPGHALPNFARFVDASKHTGALTVELMAQWARQAQGGKASAETAARFVPGTAIRYTATKTGEGMEATG